MWEIEDDDTKHNTADLELSNNRNHHDDIEESYESPAQTMWREIMEALELALYAQVMHR
jgi:hypothetical protein